MLLTEFVPVKPKNDLDEGSKAVQSKAGDMGWITGNTWSKMDPSYVEKFSPDQKAKLEKNPDLRDWYNNLSADDQDSADTSREINNYGTRWATPGKWDPDGGGYDTSDYRDSGGQADNVIGSPGSNPLRINYGAGSGSSIGDTKPVIVPPVGTGLGTATATAAATAVASPAVTIADIKDKAQVPIRVPLGAPVPEKEPYRIPGHVTGMAGAVKPLPIPSKVTGMAGAGAPNRARATDPTAITAKVEFMAKVDAARERAYQEALQAFDDMNVEHGKRKEMAAEVAAAHAAWITKQNERADARLIALNRKVAIGNAVAELQAQQDIAQDTEGRPLQGTAGKGGVSMDDVYVPRPGPTIAGIKDQEQAPIGPILPQPTKSDIEADTTSGLMPGGLDPRTQVGVSQQGVRTDRPLPPEVGGGQIDVVPSPPSQSDIEADTESGLMPGGLDPRTQVGVSMKDIRTDQDMPSEVGGGQIDVIPAPPSQSDIAQDTESGLMPGGLDPRTQVGVSQQGVRTDRPLPPEVGGGELVVDPKARKAQLQDIAYKEYRKIMDEKGISDETADRQAKLAVLQLRAVHSLANVENLVAADYAQKMEDIKWTAASDANFIRKAEKWAEAERIRKIEAIPSVDDGNIFSDIEKAEAATFVRNAVAATRTAIASAGSLYNDADETSLDGIDVNTTAQAIKAKREFMQIANAARREKAYQDYITAYTAMIEYGMSLEMAGREARMLALQIASIKAVAATEQLVEIQAAALKAGIAKAIREFKTGMRDIDPEGSMDDPDTISQDELVTPIPDQPITPYEQRRTAATRVLKLAGLPDDLAKKLADQAVADGIETETFIEQQIEYYNDIFKARENAGITTTRPGDTLKNFRTAYDPTIAENGLPNGENLIRDAYITDENGKIVQVTQYGPDSDNPNPYLQERIDEHIQKLNAMIAQNPNPQSDEDWQALLTKYGPYVLAAAVAAIAIWTAPVWVTAILVSLGFAAPSWSAEPGDGTANVDDFSNMPLDFSDIPLSELTSAQLNSEIDRVMTEMNTPGITRERFNELDKIFDALKKQKRKNRRSNS